jgi:hypothetical protein
MPINTSFSGNIPWLLTEPPTVALARGAQVGEGIAHQRLQQQQITLQAAQQAEQVARDRAIEAHRKIQEGIEQSQEARQQALFAKTASNELSRRIGMKMINDDLEIYMADHPDATPTEKAQATTQAVLKNADKVFPDGQGLVPFVQHAQDSIGRFGVMEATIKAKNASAKANESLANKREAEATNAWLGEGNTTKIPADIQRADYLSAKQKAFDEATAAGDPKLISDTKRELDAAKAAMHANRVEDRADKIANQAFRATHQALLTKLRNLYAQQSFVSAKQKPALDAQIKDIEDELGSLIQGYSSQQTGAAPATATTEDVTVISPDGVEGTIPKSNLDKAIQRGYKLKQ